MKLEKALGYKSEHQKKSYVVYAADWKESEMREHVFKWRERERRESIKQSAPPIYEYAQLLVHASRKKKRVLLLLLL